MRWEKELLGLYVSAHPYSAFRPFLDGYARPLRQLVGAKGDDRIVTAGVVAVAKKILTRKGDSMLFVKLEDEISSVEFVVFPRTLQENPSLWTPGQAVIVDGKLSEKDRETKVIVNLALPLDSSDPAKSVDDFKKAALNLPTNNFRPGRRANYPTKEAARPTLAVASPPVAPVSPVVLEKPSPRALRLTLQAGFNSEQSLALQQILSRHPGSDPVRFRVLENGKMKVIKTPFQVNNEEDLRQEIQDNFSEGVEVAN